MNKIVLGFDEIIVTNKILSKKLKNFYLVPLIYLFEDLLFLFIFHIKKNRNAQRHRISKTVQIENFYTVDDRCVRTRFAKESHAKCYSATTSYDLWCQQGTRGAPRRILSSSVRAWFSVPPIPRCNQLRSTWRRYHWWGSSLLIAHLILDVVVFDKYEKIGSCWIFFIKFGTYNLI